MQNKNLFKKGLGYQKAASDSFFTICSIVQSSGEKMMEQSLRQFSWLPETGRKGILNLSKGYSQATTTAKNMVDQGYDMLEKQVSATKSNKPGDKQKETTAEAKPATTVKAAPARKAPAKKKVTPAAPKAKTATKPKSAATTKPPATTPPAKQAAQAKPAAKSAPKAAKPTGAKTTPVTETTTKTAPEPKVAAKAASSEKTQ